MTDQLKITKSWPLNSIWYEILTADPITESHAMKLQAQAGYIPMGYGFYNFRCVQTELGQWRSTWSSGNSAD